MKAVLYHANTYRAEKFGNGVYEQLIAALRKNVNDFGMPLVHLTLHGHEGLGDENYYYPGDPKNIVWNREMVFSLFLAHASEDEYWLTEPDARIVEPIPEVHTDLVILRRQDKVPITPSWRIATKKSLPFFGEILECYPQEKQQWDGDSDAWTAVWERMGKPGRGVIEYKGMSIELRDYRDYSGQDSKYTRQWKAENKFKLLGK